MHDLSKRWCQIPCFLAVLYFAAGAHILHPPYHDHEYGVHGVDAGNDHIARNSGTGALEFRSVDHSPCPICNFFALCLATQPGGTTTWFQVVLSNKADVVYLEQVLTSSYLSFHIRGPPNFISLAV